MSFYYEIIPLTANITKAFSYISDSELSEGLRVLIPFGNSQRQGIILKALAKDYTPDFECKYILKVIDSSPILSKAWLDLGFWMSAYYLCPLGEVFKTMLPGSDEKKIKRTFALTDNAKEAIEQGQIDDSIIVLQEIFKNKSELSRATIREKLKKYPHITLKSLKKERFLTEVEEKTLYLRSLEEENESQETLPTLKEEEQNLTKEQLIALESIIKDGFSIPLKKDLKPFLLLGITGSGKTEVYLQAIAHLLSCDPSAQVLVLVPEIALTPQMTRVFQNRFGNLVGVFHSHLTKAQRWQEFIDVQNQSTKILIGARSSIFAPFANLKLIIVDEEHDQSYKQNSGLCYHARNIAVLRCKLEAAVVILGSATPSCETYHNAQIGKYHKLVLRERAKGVLPKISVIDDHITKISDQTTAYKNYGNIRLKKESISIKIIEKLEECLKKNQQAMVIINRRGYSFYLLDVFEKAPIKCPNCSVTLTLHSLKDELVCHYCGFIKSLSALSVENPNKLFLAMGLGIQKTEEILKKQLPSAIIARIDTDLTSEKDYLSNTLEDFKNHKIDILLGTQIIAKGHDFSKVSLVVLLETDSMLDLPDIRSGEKTFQLLVQASGRSGRSHSQEGEVLIQTSKQDHFVMEYGIRQDFEGFCEKELEFRKKFFYPPFGFLALLELNCANSAKLISFCNELERWICEHFSREDEVRIVGPHAPAIEKINKRYRQIILIQGKSFQKNLSWTKRLKALIEANKPYNIRLKVDVDPQSLF